MIKQRFFKYIPKQYAAGMLYEGKIKLGTIYHYREGENEEITDRNEGVSFGVVDQKKPSKFLKDNPEFFENMFFGPDNKPPYPFTYRMMGMYTMGNVYSEIKNPPNKYIYCLTTNPSVKVMMEFGKLPDGDYQEMVCIEITDIKGFAVAIHNYLVKNKFAELDNLPFGRECIYEKDGRKFELSGEFRDTLNLDVYFLKEPDLKHQYEYRLVFNSNETSANLNDVYPAIPELTRFIKLHNFFRFYMWR
ncbi:hypothetical protein [Adhaeribacter rhizoryzae]|uniref:Uncharacterized protein n=1 Tax=Adhaeribacter rhizoryzae TaxID=2607907 RepID=A0A5M6DAH8_9BACT|nr:hypothetical protein [Adhaeribacter rhizoryzae]KAA5542989.1 hypothetical protein F0145_17800 [Adhaeribacter rhizoryzae]